MLAMEPRIVAILFSSMVQREKPELLEEIVESFGEVILVVVVSEINHPVLLSALVC